MLEKLINTLRYGNAKTKQKLYFILAFFVVGIMFLMPLQETELVDLPCISMRESMLLFLFTR